MRATELLGRSVVDRDGVALGPVRDVRVVRDDWRVVGLVVGDGRLARIAHGWGFTEGRAQGPWPLRALTAEAVRRARFVASEQVAAWGPGEVRLHVVAADLRPLTAELAD